MRPPWITRSRKTSSCGRSQTEPATCRAWTSAGACTGLAIWACLLVATGFFASPPAPGSDQLEAERLAIERLIDSGRLAEARQAVESQLATKGQIPFWLFWKSKILFKEKKFTESIETLTRLLTMRRDGYELRSSKNTGDRSFPRDPLDAEAYKLVGLNYVQLDKLDLAEPFLMASTQLAPADHLGHFNLGMLYFTTSRFAAAEKEFREVIRLRPSFSQAFATLALTLEEIGSEEETDRTYRRAIELADLQELKDGMPYLSFGKYLFKKNHVQQCLPLLQRAVELSPRSAEAYYHFGKALHLNAENEKAIAALQRCSQLDPSLADPHYLLSRIYLKQGRPVEANEEMNRFKELQKSQAGRKREPTAPNPR